jgi:hypothetical protein
MAAKDTSWGPMIAPLEQESIIINIPKLPFQDRIIKCYSNFHFLTTTKYGYDRVDAINQIPKNLVYYEPTNIVREKTWINQSKYAFVISPHGNGYDCHRTWEALVLGNIPIVKTSGLDSLFTDLPILIVNEWNDINQELLNNTILKFKNSNFNYNKLLLSYWIKIIKDIYNDTNNN